MRRGWFEPTPPPEPEATQPPLIKSIGWFVAIAAMSGLSVVFVAYALRGLLFLD